MRIAVACPAPAGSLQGNRVTAERLRGLFRELGHEVAILDEQADPDAGLGAAELLVALHAIRSAGEVAAFRARHPHRPVVLILTGTDLYAAAPERAAPDRASGGRAARDAATRLVVLQPAALEQLAPAERARARVVLQSARPLLPRPEPRTEVFEVVQLAHLREVKDPLLGARAMTLVPARSHLELVHAGQALGPAWRERAEAALRATPRYRWLGDLAHGAAQTILARARVFLQTSRSEGGSTAMSEALVHGLAIVATRIPGATGMLGEAHPGLFPVGDAAELARRLLRCEEEPEFLAELQRHSRALAPDYAPERELAAWRALLAELA